MQSKNIRYLLLPSLLLASAFSNGVVQSDFAKTANQTLHKSVYHASKSKHHIALPAPSEKNTQRLQNGLTLNRYPVGFSRNISLEKAISQSEWVLQEDGSNIQTISVSSADAKAVRIILTVTSIADEATLHFFKDASSPSVATSTGVLVNKIIALNANSTLNENRYDSPIVDGDSAILEIRLPKGANPDNTNVTLIKIAHFVASPFDDQVNSAGTCNIDLACRQGTWGETATSVAKLIYTIVNPPAETTDGGGTPTEEVVDPELSDETHFLCSGTLINDTDKSSQKPYLLTAEHCISTQDEASTLSTFWFFQRSNCNGSDPVSVTQVSGGSELLVHGGIADYTLLELLETPPENASFSDWSTSAISPFHTPITAIHHPSGDLTKISTGHVISYTDQPAIEPLPDGSTINLTDAITINWSSGVIEPGSSGSALFNDQHQIVGIASAGSVSCENPNGIGLYGRFDLAFPSLKKFLDPPTVSNATLNNISTRGFSGVGDDVAIAGFEISGNDDKTVVIRAAGPSTGQATGSILLDTTLDLLKNGAIIATNDNWLDGSEADAIEAAGFGLSSSKESAIKVTLAPGSYTAIMRGKNNSTGLGLVAVDAFDDISNSKLSNISTRILINDGDQIAIAGFEIGGTDSKTIAIRAAGPSMSSLGIANALADPSIEVYSGNNKIASNDDWQNGEYSADVQANGFAPTDSLESALVLTLQPGPYTVKVRGRNGSSGIALIAIDEI